MLTLLPEALAEYVHAHTSEQLPLFEELREATYAQLEDPQMQVGRVEGTFLRMLVQLMGARRVLELGTFSGYSALSMAAGLPEDGRITTCDLDPKATSIAQSFFDRSPDGSKIEIRLGPAADTLDNLSREGATFDLAFIDADKESYVAYWDAIVPMLRPGGLVVADNTLWGGAVLEPKTGSDHGIVNFNAHVRADERVEHVLLSVRDGMMLARKRG